MHRRRPASGGGGHRITSYGTRVFALTAVLFFYDGFGENRRKKTVVIFLVFALTADGFFSNRTAFSEKDVERKPLLAQTQKGIDGSCKTVSFRRTPQTATMKDRRRT